MSKIIIRFAATGVVIGIINNILFFIIFSSGITGFWRTLSSADRGLVVLINAVFTFFFFIIILFPGLVSK